MKATEIQIGDRLFYKGQFNACCNTIDEYARHV